MCCSFEATDVHEWSGRREYGVSCSVVFESGFVEMHAIPSMLLLELLACGIVIWVTSMER